MNKGKAKKVVVQVYNPLMQDSESSSESELPELNATAKKKNVVQQKKNAKKVISKP